MPAASPDRHTRVDVTETVESIGRRSPRALDAMKTLGLTHCCGARLTLAEPAAAVGVPLDALVSAVEAALAMEVSA